MIRPDVWVLAANWFDEHDHWTHTAAYFDTRRDAHAVGEALRAQFKETQEYDFTVHKIAPWPSTTRDIPFSHTPTVDEIADHLSKEWDL